LFIFIAHWSSYQIFIYTPKQYMLITANFQTNGNNRNIDHHMTVMLMNIPIKTHVHGLFLKKMLMIRLLGEMTHAI
jgi:hypothetical protein